MNCDHCTETIHVAAQPTLPDQWERETTVNKPISTLPFESCQYQIKELESVNSYAYKDPFLSMFRHLSSELDLDTGLAAQEFPACATVLSTGRSLVD